MSHLGSKSDKSLPYQTIVFGGHTHDRQIDYQEKKLVINTGAGECIVAIRGSGPQTEIETTIIEAAGYAPSPVIKALIARYEEKYRIDLNKFIFSITPDSVKPSGLELSEEEAQTAKSHLRINDALITRATADAIATGCDHIDFALYPVAAIRSNFQPDQKIDLKLLFSTYYYDNTLAAVSLTGAELITLLAHGIMSGYKCWENRGQLLIPSAGLTYHYDISVDPGKTIQWVKIKGKFIDPDAKFTFVTTNWIAEEVLKLFPAKALTPYPKELKIFSLVATHLQDSVLKESFGERVTCNQSFKEQLALAQQPGNLRKDKPPFDRYKVLVDIDSHRHYFLESLKNISQNPSTLLVAQPTAAATEENRLPPTSAMA
jgi:2',3'-cyclic-nucleotide 2'-phosphodiesterase (5'-nucleotidase family)